MGPTTAPVDTTGTPLQEYTVAAEPFAVVEKEPAPTNTGNSKYIDTGNTAADKIGADRARAHRRLPNGVAPPQ